MLPSRMNLRFVQAFVMLAARVNPYPLSQHFHNLAFAYHQLERYQEAIAKAKRAIDVSSEDTVAYRALTWNSRWLQRGME